MIITLSVILFFTILTMAFFSGSEIGLISCQKSRIATMVKNGSKRAKMVKFVLDRPALMLSTTLVGTNICTVCSSVLAKQIAIEAGMSITFCTWFISLILPLLLLFPEIIPKNWFRQAPARRCVFFSPLFMFMLTILYPISKLIAMITSASVRIFDEDSKQEQSTWLLREDFRFLIRDSENDGTIDSEAADILDRSLKFHQLKVKDILIPIKKVKYIEATSTIREAAELCKKHDLSLLPIKSKRGNWLGIFSIYDAIFSTNEKTWDKLIVTACMHDLYSMKAEQNLPEVIAAAQKNNCRMLAVKDEKDKVIGIVTPSDVSDELFVKGE